MFVCVSISSVGHTVAYYPNSICGHDTEHFCEKNNYVFAFQKSKNNKGLPGRIHIGFPTRLLEGQLECDIIPSSNIPLLR